jgi:hypothetical protein
MKPIAPRRLLKAISMARGSCGASSVVDVDLRHTLGSDSENPQIDQVDIEMEPGGSGFGSGYETGSCSLWRLPCDV